MYRKCVKKCKGDESTTYHRIPKKPDQRNIWLDLLDLPETASGRVCSKQPIEIANEVEIQDVNMVDDASNEVRLDLNIIYKEHNYVKKVKPISLKRTETGYKNRLLTMNIRRKLNRLQDRIKKMANEHKREMKKFENFSKLSQFLQEFVLILLKHHKKHSAPRQYSAEIRKFALSLHYYSPAGYEFLSNKMEDQAANSSYLLQMPLLVIEKILSDVLNRSSVSRTCKTLYDIVCDVEKRKRVVISIKRMATTDNSVRLTIDDDVVFASIKSSLRRITEIRLDLGYSPVKLNERQLERITAIMKRFGTSVTSLILSGIVISTNEIIELLSLTPKLETLKFVSGTASGNATKLLHLPNLKTLEIFTYNGLLAVINSIPAGSLNYFSYDDVREEPEVLKTVVTKQHNIKFLTFRGDFDPIDLCVNHLQLEKLDLEMPYNNDQLVEILKCHTNLKELRLTFQISVSAFEWICNNLKKLEVFQVRVDRYDTQGKNLLVMLRELKNLLYLSTNVIDSLDGKVQFQINSLEKLKIENVWSNYQDINEILHLISGTFTNLTDLEMRFRDFSQLSIVLTQCTKLIRLTSHIQRPDPQQLAGKRFPNIRQLSISTFAKHDFNIIVSIVRAMPNLKSLSMHGYTTFNVDMVKEFVCEKNRLEDLYLHHFKLDNLSTSEDFVSTVRCLSDHLKTYRLTFTARQSGKIRAILSNEFKVRYDPYDDPSCFDLYKGDLTHDEFID